MKTQTLFQEIASLDEAFTDKSLALTVYQPITPTMQKFETDLNSSFSQALNEEARLTQAQGRRLEEFLIDAMTTRREEEKGWAAALGMYVVINPDETAAEDQSVELDGLVSAITVIGLPAETARQSLVERRFELRLAIQTLQQDQDTLIVHLEEENAKLYGLQAKQLETLAEVENPYTTDRDERYIEKNSAGPQKSFYFGTGDRSLEATQAAGDKYFLRSDVADAIQELLNEQDWEHVVVLYSARFADYIQQTMEEAVKPHTDAILSARSTNALAESEDHQEIVGLIEQHTTDMQRKHIASLHKDAREAFDHLTQDWDVTTEAARNGALQHLFIRMDVQHEGLIDDAGLIYDAHEEIEPDAAATTRLGTLLTWRALETDAEVHVVTQDMVDAELSDFEGEVLGVRRYVA